MGLAETEVLRRVKQSMMSVGLTGVRIPPAVSLSGGEKRRVAIAGVLAMEPDVLLLTSRPAILIPVAAGIDSNFWIACPLRA
jgi:energy-coupling factor transport system ATP-binding protein